MNGDVLSDSISENMYVIDGELITGNWYNFTVESRNAYGYSEAS